MRNHWLTNQRVINWDINEAFGDTVREKFETFYVTILNAIHCIDCNKMEIPECPHGITLTMNTDTEMLFQCFGSDLTYDYENRVWDNGRSRWQIVVNDNLSMGEVHIARS